MNELDKPVRLTPDGTIDERDAKRLEDHIMAVLELRIMRWVDQPKKEKTMSKITVTEEVEWEFKWKSQACYVYQRGKCVGSFPHERTIDSRWPAEAKAEARRVIQANRPLGKDETRAAAGDILQMDTVVGEHVLATDDMGTGLTLSVRNLPERIDFYERHRPLKDNEIRDPEGYPREMVIRGDKVDVRGLCYWDATCDGHRRVWGWSVNWPSDSARLEAFDRMKAFLEKNARPPKPEQYTADEFACIQVGYGTAYALKRERDRQAEIREWEAKYGD